MPDTIAIDARPLLDPTDEAHVYCLHLVHALAYSARDLRFHLFFDREPEGVNLPSHERCDASILTARRAVWKLSALAPAAARAGCRLVHVHGLLPSASPLPVVTTIRGLGPLDEPASYPATTVTAWRRLLPRQLLGAAAVLSCAETQAEAVATRLGLPREQITVTPYGVESAYRPQCDGVQTAVTRQLGLPPRFILGRATDGRAEPLVALYHALVEATGTTLPLVLEGAVADGVRHFARLESRLGPGLLSASEVVLLGGGGEPAALALIESMACGAPTVGGADPLLRELAGPAAALGSPAEQLAAASRWLTDAEARSKPLRGGLARVKGRTWPAMAEATMAVYRGVLEPLSSR